MTKLVGHYSKSVRCRYVRHATPKFCDPNNQTGSTRVCGLKWFIALPITSPTQLLISVRTIPEQLCNRVATVESAEI